MARSDTAPCSFHLLCLGGIPPPSSSHLRIRNGIRLAAGALVPGSHSRRSPVRAGYGAGAALRLHKGDAGRKHVTRDGADRDGGIGIAIIITDGFHIEGAGISAFNHQRSRAGGCAAAAGLLTGIGTAFLPQVSQAAFVRDGIVKQSNWIAAVPGLLSGMYSATAAATYFFTYKAAFCGVAGLHRGLIAGYGNIGCAVAGFPLILLGAGQLPIFPQAEAAEVASDPHIRRPPGPGCSMPHTAPGEPPGAQAGLSCRSGALLFCPPGSSFQFSPRSILKLLSAPSAGLAGVRTGCPHLRSAFLCSCIPCCTTGTGLSCVFPGSFSSAAASCFPGHEISPCESWFFLFTNPHGGIFCQDRTAGSPAFPYS